MTDASGLDLVIRGDRVVIDGTFVPAEVGVRGGMIVLVARSGTDAVPASVPESGAAPTVELAHDEVLIPGLVDMHVHVNEPGRTEWEGFATATRAAAAGGVTTIVDMPLNSIPPTTTVAALDVKRRAAERQVFVDVGFWGGVVPGTLADLAVVAPDAAFIVDAATLEHRHPITPYDGRELVGAVRATYLAGVPVDRRTPRGRLLRRPAATEETT